MSKLNEPYGGNLVDLVVHDQAERAQLETWAVSLKTLQLSPRSLCDLEMLATGAFSPLTTFMGQADYTSVLTSMRLANCMVFPIPITLPLSAKSDIGLYDTIALRDAHNRLMAVMTVTEKWIWNLEEEALAVVGVNDPKHPLVAEMATWGQYYISGPLKVLTASNHVSFTNQRATPAELRKTLMDIGNERVVAFQTRNPIHRAHEELTKRAAASADATLLIQPVVGMTKPGDIDFYTRVRCYNALMTKHYDRAKTVLNLLPLAMRMAGPREAVLHAIVRRNYGASHFIVGRDHAGPGNNSQGKPFYSPYAAQVLAQSFSKEIGMEIVAFEEMVYLPSAGLFAEASKTGGLDVLTLSGTQVRDMLAAGQPLPDWFTRPEVAEILADVSVPKRKQGFCVWFTGLSGAGKTAVAEILAEMLLERGRSASMLDGDVVRTHLSKGLGFSKEDRDTNIARIGFVAGEIVRHNGVVLCAAISPYEAARNQAKAMVGADRFVMVHVSTSLEVCEERDLKGLYAKAKAGLAKGVTGVDDPYEVPISPEITIDGGTGTPKQHAQTVLDHLIARGWC